MMNIKEVVIRGLLSPEKTNRQPKRNNTNQIEKLLLNKVNQICSILRIENPNEALTTGVMTQIAVCDIIGKLEDVIEKFEARRSTFKWSINIEMSLSKEDLLAKGKLVKSRLKITDERLDFLSKLNQLLTQRLNRIKEKAERSVLFTYLKSIENLPDNIEYTIEVVLIFFLKGIHADIANSPNHFIMLNSLRSTWECFDELSRRQLSHLPVLNRPYCYLLNDLLNHSGLSDDIYSISSFWISYKITDQSGATSKGKWEMISNEQLNME